MRLPSPGVSAAALVLSSMLASASARAVQSAELYRTEALLYGRFEARTQFAPGEGVVSSFFLWKDGSSSTTSWNELDFEKMNATCRFQTNIWTGTGTQSPQVETPTADLCGAYHTYAFEWTPDYIAWFIDGTQIRRETGAIVADYVKNASQGMTIHFNVWVGDSTFAGVLDPTILPVNQYIDWVQYSSYTNGTFQQQWREEFDGAGIPAGWAVGNWTSALGHSTHNPANVSFVNGIAVLSMTADDQTGYSGPPPVDVATDAGVLPPSSSPTASASGSNGCGCDTGQGETGRILDIIAIVAAGASLMFRRRREVTSCLGEPSRTARSPGLRRIR
jgi:hypothetical protein